jgi:DNA mismatch repair protein MutS2
VIRWLLARIKGYRFSDEDLMSQLLDQVYGDLEPAVAELLGACLELEFYLVALGFAKFCRSAGHEVCLPEFSDADDDAAVGNADDSSRRILHGLFNPWLLAQGVKTIPFDDEQPDARCTVILTGPNSGGKTRYLQALAVSQLLGQVGLFVPASKARLLWVEQIFLSLLERAEANQEEGRLGMELLRIRHVFETSGQHSLIVMDELCSGTNPSEGEQIFDMVLLLLDELRPQVLISTHFLDFAERLAAQERPRLSFLQVELGPGDVPTYQFVPGVARTSLARNTAARLGVTQDELLELVERHRKQKSSVPSS